jgi:predicted metalloendopeptidase
VWRLVDTYANHLSWEYRQARFRFLEMRQGSQEFPPVWDECLGVVGTRMGVALAAEFLNAHIGSAKKENVCITHFSLTSIYKVDL